MAGHGKFEILALPLQSGVHEPSELRRMLKESLEPVLLQGKEQEVLALVDRVMVFELARDAVRCFESKPKLCSALLEGSQAISPERKNTIRIAYARFLLRAGFYLQARRIIKSAQPKTAADYTLSGIVSMAFGEIGRALKPFKVAHELNPEDAPMAVSYYFALGHAGGALEAVGKLEKILREKAGEDREGFISARLAECLRLDGRPADAKVVLMRALERLQPQKDLKGEKAPYTLLKGHLLHELSSNEARLGNKEKARALIDEVLAESMAIGISYPNLLMALWRAADSGIARESELNLLRLASSRIPDFDPAGRFRAPFEMVHGSKKASERLKIDLARDEFQVPANRQPHLGVPLEVRMAAYIAVAFAPFADIPARFSPCVRRGLLIDLLWPDSPAPITSLDGRLSKLLQRAEEEYGLEVRDMERNLILMPTQAKVGVEVHHHPSVQTPGYVEGTSTPTASGLALHYGLSPSHGRLWVRRLKAQGLWREGASRKAKKAA